MTVRGRVVLRAERGEARARRLALSPAASRWYSVGYRAPRGRKGSLVTVQRYFNYDEDAFVINFHNV
jgi:hypothetical protein